MFRVTRRPEGLPKCESLAQPLSGSSEVRVTGSAAARSARGSATEAAASESGRTPGRSAAAAEPRGQGVTPGPRDSRLEQPVVVHPGIMPNAGQPARDRR